MPTLVLIFLSQFAMAQGTALVYAGPGTCESCVEGAATIARRAGLSVRFVRPADIKPAIFQGAEVWIQPGGNAITVVRSISQRKLALIRAFVESGKSYFGICAGGFLADRFVDDHGTLAGLGLLPVTTHDYGWIKTPLTLEINWAGRMRQMYFEEGPGFAEPPPNTALVVARYSDNVPAALITTFGRGRVAVSGPHPEASREWFSAENLVRTDGFETDEDLAVEMMESILPNERTRNCAAILTLSRLVSN